MEYIIYTYGGFAELIAQIFNSMAILFYSDSAYFTNVGKLAFTVGGVWAGTRAIFNTNIGIFGKHWFLPSFFAFTLLFAPKATVHIHDGGTKEAYTVANVPFAVAFFSSIPSQLSHYLSHEIEEKMATPESVKSHNGIMFGAKLLSEVKDVTVQDRLLLTNAKEFSKQCYLRPWIMGNIRGKRQEAETTTDIIQFLQTNKINNFGMYYKEANGGSTFKLCKDATDDILKGLDEEAKKDDVLGSIYSGLSNKDVTTQHMAKRMTDTGQGALTALSIETNNFHQRVRQSMMLNVYRESLDDWRESAGYQRYHPQLVSMSATRGMFQQSLGWIVSGEMAAQLLPLLQTILFLMTACSIFVVFPLALFPGGYEILKVWIKSLIWVHTWPVFFAIINSIGMAVLSTRLGAFGDDYGLNKLTQGGFSDKLIHTYAICQWIAASVPIFSWALLNKGGYAFANMVERMSPLGVGGNIGGSIADGNLSLNNQNLSGRSMNQQNVGSALDVSSMYHTGAVRVTQSQDGQAFVNQNISNLRENYRANEIEQAATQQSYAEQQSKMDALTTRKGELASAEQSNLQDISKRWLSSEDATRLENSRVANAASMVSSGGVNLSDNYNDRTTKSTDTHSSLDMNARFGGDTSSSLVGKVIKAVSGIDLGFNMSAQTGTSARNTDEVGHDQSAQQTQSYNEALNTVREYFKNEDVKSGANVSDSTSENLQSIWREQDQIAKDEAQTLQKMQQLQRQQLYVQQNQSTVDSNWNDKVLEKVQSDQGLSNKQEALAYLESHPGAGKTTLQNLVNEKYGLSGDAIAQKGEALQKEVTSKVPTESINFEASKAALQDQHNQAAEKIKSGSNVKQQVETDIQAAKDKQMGQIAEQSASDFQKTMQQEGVGGKVKVNTSAEQLQKEAALKKTKFEDTSNSTLVRAGKEVSKNVDDVGNPMVDKSLALFKRSTDSILQNAEQKDKLDRETNPFDPEYKPKN